MIAVVDIGTGNLRSVLESLRRVGASARVARSGGDLDGASGIVLPGVGAFREGMRRLHEQILAEPIRMAARNGVPVLGVCLGMQLLADVGFEHGRCEGLGIIGGEVVPLVPGVHCARVPNMGWRGVSVRREGRLMPKACYGEHFFFAHSFHFVANDRADVAATLEGNVTACVERGNVFGVQFHPEKSQDAGLDLLARFAHVAGAASSGSAVGKDRAVA